MHWPGMLMHFVLVELRPTTPEIVSLSSPLPMSLTMGYAEVVYYGLLRVNYW